MSSWLDFDLCIMDSGEDTFFVLMFAGAGVLLGFVLAWAARRLGYLDRLARPTLFGASLGCLFPVVIGILMAGLLVLPWRRWTSPDACGGVFTPDGIILALDFWMTPIFTAVTVLIVAYRASK